MQTFNLRLKQIIILIIIVVLIYVVLSELIAFVPGFLGAITLYVLSRANYFQLVYQRKWKRGWSAMLIIFYYTLVIGLPIYLAITLISPKIDMLIHNSDQVIASFKKAINHLQANFKMQFISEKKLDEGLNAVSQYVPSLLNSTATVVTNVVLMLFVLYHMLVNGRAMEKNLARFIPLKPSNVNTLASETKKMVKANAIGIPIISLAQGAVAMLGYFLFGVEEWLLWGFVTGVFAFFPVIGTAVVWAPLVIYMYGIGMNWQATWLIVYSLLVTGNVDYLVRITLLKKMGDIHPVITIFGVIVGLNLFGFIGVVFGPLLISYILILIEIYVNEFVENDFKISEEIAADSTL